MSLKPNELKALAWYVEQKDWRPQLSTYPMMYFLDKDGQEHQAHMLAIESAWLKWRKEEKEKDGGR